MLRPDGEIHVNHKTSSPYNLWHLEQLASKNSLRLIECVIFDKEDYLGYENKRGSGKRCDDCFLLGECCTFKFSFSPNAKGTEVNQKVNRSQKLAKAPKFVPQQLSSFEFRNPSADVVLYMNDTPALNIPYGKSRELLQNPKRAPQQGNYLQHNQPLHAAIYSYHQENYLEHRQPSELVPAPICAYQQENYLTLSPTPSSFDLHMSGIPECMGSPHIDRLYLECSRIFSPYFELVVKALKNGHQNSSYFLEDALNVGYERYMAGDPRRTLSDYRYMLEQLRKYFVGRPEGHTSRQLSKEYGFASNRSSRHFRS